MTDYLEEILKAGSLLDETRQMERKSTVSKENVEKKENEAPPLLKQVRRTEGIFHRQRQNSVQRREEHREVFHTSPRFGENPLKNGELRPFSPLSVFEQQEGLSQAEEVDRAFQRDSRRYDGGFFLY